MTHFPNHSANKGRWNGVLDKRRLIQELVTHQITRKLEKERFSYIIDKCYNISMDK
jgi:hypothetical protein